MPSLPPKIEHFSILANNSRKIEIPVLSYWEKYFLTFSQQKFSYVIFDRNHFFYYIIAFKIINQSIITTGTSFTTRWNALKLKLPH